VPDAAPRLSPEQVAIYREQGWLALGAVLSPGEAAALRAEEERFRLPVAYGGPKNQTLFVNVQLCHRSEPVRRFCTAGRHLKAVVQLLGPNVCLTHQQFVTKLPERGESSSEIAFHQDNGYGRLEPPKDLTVWVALIDTDERNGCLWLVPGSHRLGLVEHAAAASNPLLREAAAGEGAIALPLRAGEAVAFSGMLLHRSGPNLSQAPRPGLFVRYCDPHVVMASEGGRPVLEDPHSWMVAGEA
jgi:ectoine hydroxylase-related dioxygenase (phytanoyl-CoA dioxygenase family)